MRSRVRKPKIEQMAPLPTTTTCAAARGVTRARLGEGATRQQVGLARAQTAGESRVQAAGARKPCDFEANARTLLDWWLKKERSSRSVVGANSPAAYQP
eukprot:4474510-Prymnesium_polylepis.1